MTPDMIVRLDQAGNQISERRRWKASSEIKMHMEAYRKRPDIRAVVHLHPPYATSFAVSGIPLDQYIMTEAVVTLGPVSIAPFATPSTQEVPDAISEIVEKSDALLLANHGALTVGSDLLSAYERMETLEHYAHILTLSFHLGGPKHFTDEQIKKLLEMKNRLCVPGRINMEKNPSGSKRNPVKPD
jgi:L-fuculose-phosphate aldolase